MTWAEWSGGLGRAVAVGGGRSAATIPGDIWVLDADNPQAVRELFQLAAGGALPASRVLAYDRSIRGCHLWTQAEYDGWTTATAQRAIRALGVKALEVKSRNSWVIFPTEFDLPEYTETARRWLPVEHFWAEVEHFATLRTGGGALGRKLRTFDGEIAAGVAPVPPPVVDTPTTSVPGLGAPSVLTAWGNLRQWCDWLARSSPGERNHRLNRIAWVEGRTAISAGVRRDAVEEVLRRAALSSGLGASETDRTIRSALGGVA